MVPFYNNYKASAVLGQKFELSKGKANLKSYFQDRNKINLEYPSLCFFLTNLPKVHNSEH